MLLEQARRLIPYNLQNKTWKAGEHTVTEDTLAQLLFNLLNDREPTYLISPTRTDRRFDKAAQILRKEGLIVYDREKTAWRMATPDDGTRTIVVAGDWECHCCADDVLMLHTDADQLGIFWPEASKDWTFMCHEAERVVCMSCGFEHYTQTDSDGYMVIAECYEHEGNDAIWEKEYGS